MKRVLRVSLISLHFTTYLFMQDLYISEYKIAFTVDVNCVISDVIGVRFLPETKEYIHK